MLRVVDEIPVEQLTAGSRTTCPKEQIEKEGVVSQFFRCLLIHLENISYRLGELQPLSKNDPFGGYAEGNETFRRCREHLIVNGVDATKSLIRVGSL